MIDESYQISRIAVYDFSARYLLGGVAWILSATSSTTTNFRYVFSYFSPSNSRNPPSNHPRSKIEQSPEEQVILMALVNFQLKL